MENLTDFISIGRSSKPGSLLNSIDEKYDICINNGDYLGAGEWLICKLSLKKCGDKEIEEIFAKTVSLWASPFALKTIPVTLDDLIKDNPDKFNIGNLRTLQRRTAQWRKEQTKINQQRCFENALTQDNVVNKYISLVAHSVIGG